MTGSQGLAISLLHLYVNSLHSLWYTYSPRLANKERLSYTWQKRSHASFHCHSHLAQRLGCHTFTIKHSILAGMSKSTAVCVWQVENNSLTDTGPDDHKTMHLIQMLQWTWRGGLHILGRLGVNGWQWHTQEGNKTVHPFQISQHRTICVQLSTICIKDFTWLIPQKENNTNSLGKATAATRAATFTSTYVFADLFHYYLFVYLFVYFLMVVVEFGCLQTVVKWDPSFYPSSQERQALQYKPRACEIQVRPLGPVTSCSWRVGRLWMDSQQRLYNVNTAGWWWQTLVSCSIRLLLLLLLFCFFPLPSPPPFSKFFF